MFTCETCGKDFDLPQAILDRYPGWTPRQCLDCRDKAKGSEGASTPQKKRATSRTKGVDLTRAEVLAEFEDGPDTGVFCDGSSEGNPGPGGWGAVWVENNEILDEAWGYEPHTTNNRMELTALIAGLKMLPADAEIDVYTDSQLVVNIITKWAQGWEAKGWKKKSAGPIANLELVQEAYRLYRERPGVSLRWIQAHSGYRWNEYADALATAYRREET
jgi:ribonuclease HI